MAGDGGLALGCEQRRSRRAPSEHGERVLISVNVQMSDVSQSVHLCDSVYSISAFALSFRPDLRLS